MNIAHPKDTQPDDYRSLVESIAGGDAIAIVGAGSSFRMGYPSWTKLLEKLCIEAINVDSSQKEKLGSLLNTDLLVCADITKKVLGEDKFYSILQEIFGPINPPHDEFHELLTCLPFGHFLTTNYDRILQVAYEKSKNESYAELDLDESQAISGFFDTLGSKNVAKHFIHIHGSIRNPSGIILAQEDYDERYAKRNELTEFLKLIFTHKVVFIGFSLSDNDFMGPLKFLTACLGKGDPRHTAIIPKPSNEKTILGLEEKLRSQYRIQPIFYDPHNNHEFLIPFLKDLKEDVEIRQKELIYENISFFENLQQTDDFTTLFQATESIKNLLQASVTSSQHDSTISEGEPSSELDEEITAIFSYVKDGKPEVAIEMYKAILEDSKRNLSPRHQYRLHSNIGNALYTLNRPKEAADKFIQATDCWLSSKESRANRALGYILYEDYDKALEITAAIIEEYPEYPRAYALHIQSLPDEYPFRKARKSVPVKLRKDPEIAYALGSLAHDQGLQKAHELYMQIAWKNQEDWTEAGVSYAVSILKQERERAIICGGTKLIPRNIDRIKDADHILSKCLDLLQDYDPTKRKGIILYNRSTVRKMLQLDSEARSDIEEAYRCDRHHPNIIAAYALQRERDGDRKEAIRILEEHEKSQSDPSLSFLLANMLFRRSEADDLEHALSILAPWCKNIDLVLPVRHRYDLLRIASEMLLQLNRPQDAISLAEELSEASISQEQKQLLLLYIKLTAKLIDQAEATKICNNIVANLPPDADYFFVRDIALFADKVECYQLSFDLWKRLTSPLDYNYDTQDLLRAGLNSKEYGYVIEFCKQLRENQLHHRVSYVTEIEALIQCHEFNEALSVMTTWIELHSDDKEMIMNRSIIASQVGRDEYIEKSPDRLPSIEEVRNAEYGIRVANALKLTDDIVATIDYTYRLWRKFSDDMSLRHLLIITSINNEQDLLEQEKDLKIRCGHAVVYKSIDSEQIQTHIIEDAPSPSLERDEYPPDHQNSQILMGKGIGEVVIIGKRAWKITEIRTKYLFVASKLLRNFCVVFPDNPLMQEFRVPTKIDSHEDFQESLKEIRAFMQNREERQKTVEGLYQQGLLPLVKFANYMGKSVLETMLFFAASPNHKILVCQSVENEFAETINQLSKGCDIVLDETAIATLFMLDLHKCLDLLPYNLIIPESLLFEIRKVIKHASSRKHSDLYIGISNGELAVQRVSPTEHANWINSLEELLFALNDKCSIEGGKALLGFQPELRDKLIKALRPANADALAIAKQNNIIFWTDDLLSGALAAELKIKNAWSQAILYHAKDIDQKLNENYETATKNMFLWGYNFTLITVATLINIFKDSKWNLKDKRIAYVEEFLSRLGAVNPHNRFATCCLIAEIWMKCHKRRVARQLILQLLDKLRNHARPEDVARYIYRGQHELFRVSVNPKIRSLKQMLRIWRMTSSGKQ